MNKRPPIDPEERVLHLIKLGVVRPSRIAQRSNLEIGRVHMAMAKLQADGKIAKERTAVPLTTCLLAEVWR